MLLRLLYLSFTMLYATSYRFTLGINESTEFFRSVSVIETILLAAAEYDANDKKSLLMPK